MSELMKAVMAAFNVEQNYDVRVKDKVLEPLEKELKQLTAHLQNAGIRYVVALNKGNKDLLGEILFSRGQEISMIELECHHGAVSILNTETEDQAVVPVEIALLRTSDMVADHLKYKLSDDDRMKFERYLETAPSTAPAPR